MHAKMTTVDRPKPHGLTKGSVQPARWALLGAVMAIALGVGLGLVLPVPAAAQDTDARKADWWDAVELCDKANRPACDRAVTLAKTLFERTDRNVAITWMKVCMAGDTDRCEIGYRRFRATSFEDDPRPISHMFARAACIGGLHDLCRPWDDFETADEDARALVMADVCLQGASPGTCNRALAHFRHSKGLYNTVTGDLSKALCERYMSGSACRVLAEYSEANWAYGRAYRFHKYACEQGLQSSCLDADRIKERLDYEQRARERKIEREERYAAAQARGRSYRTQLQAQGYAYNPASRIPATPFGSGRRDRENWNRYNRNLCMGNPTSTSC